MISLSESILKSVGAGKDSDEAFAKFFKEALNKSFGNYIYEKGLEVYIEGNYARAEYPLVKGRERIFTTRYFEYCIENLIDILGDCKDPYWAYEGTTRRNNIDDEDEQFPVRTKIYMGNKVPMWSKTPYFFIGISKDPSTNKPAFLDIDGDAEQIKKLYKK